MKFKNLHNMLRVSVLLSGAVALTACAETRREYKYFQDMHYSPAGDTAKFDRIGKRQYDMYEPENTIAYNGLSVYPYKKDVDAEAAARELKAPANVDLKKGEKKYQIYCAPCHGAQGYADGLVAKKFAGVRPLATAAGKPTERAEGFSIAKIYHIATAGQGAMQGYSPQVQEQDRWNIAAYVKNELQKRK
jgi:mono/diheme cytochrome c family protein